MRRARSRRPRLLSRPESGWSSLLLLCGMLVVVGFSLADSRPLPLGADTRTDVSLTLPLVGGLVGYLLARSRIGLGRAHALGALVGVAILLLVAGAGVTDGGAPLILDLARVQDRLGGLGQRAREEFGSLLDGSSTTPGTLAFLLLGGLCWATGQFSAFGVFRHGRAGPAIAASGGLLLLNEVLPALGTSADRWPTVVLLAAYSTLAMLLVIRMRLRSHERQWARRQFTESAEVHRRYLGAGSMLVLGVVVGASSLAALATVPAPRIDVGPFAGPLDDLRGMLGRWLALVAVDVSTPTSSTLGNRLTVADAWQQGDGLAFTADVPGGLLGNYWWLSAFADFDGRSWSREDTTTRFVVADEPIGVPADASGAGPSQVMATVVPRRSPLSLGTVVAPSEALAVSRDVQVRSLGDDEGLSEILFEEEVARGDSYQVSSAVYDYDDTAGQGAGSLTAWQLRAAGDGYPAWIDRYLRVEAGASGPRTARLAAEIEAAAARQDRANAYDKTSLLQDRLRGLEYSTTVEGLCGEGENVPECLLRTETGFCQHFATTMVMVLREMEIPARLVSGYLPGIRTEDDRYEVPLQALHAWVEVFFPGTGWVRFDPTPGQQLRRFDQRPTRLAEGEPLASPVPGESPPPTALPTPGAPAEPSASPGTAVVATGEGTGPWSDSVAVAAFIIAGLALVVVLFLVRLRRLPGTDPGLAFGRIASLAGRLGHPASPTQTDYEYAASLSETLPSVRDDLYLVAHARVEVRYGRRQLPQERRATLSRAYARIRTALLRLAWRSGR